MKYSKVYKITLAFLVLLCIGSFFYLRREVRKLKAQNQSTQQSFFSLQTKLCTQIPLIRGITFPTCLVNIPFGEDTGVVLDVKQVNIRNIPAPYNASIIEHGDHFRLFFRYDEIDSRAPSSYYPRIGCIEIDSGFHQTEKEFVRIDTKSGFSEDPRILTVGNELYLVYNDLFGPKKEKRGIHVARLNPKDLSVDFTTLFNPNQKSIEKNWVPFEFVNETNPPKLCFEYYIFPRHIFEIPDPKVSEFISISLPNENFKNKTQWPRAWGAPRGGTPAKKIGDEYLAFFHSTFLDEQRNPWYVMGAYTFEAKFPHRVTAISHYPIFFRGIFETPPLNTANPLLRAIYPSGFVIKEHEGKELIYLSCGENDSCIKILTIDKDALLKSLKKL